MAFTPPSGIRENNSLRFLLSGLGEMTTSENHLKHACYHQ
ncbi:hypothetical protein P10159_4413 [Citrobacter portucalensis]|nr:hypothetical protein P10159_4413 [Citrobacter portucalensis]